MKQINASIIAALCFSLSSIAVAVEPYHAHESPLQNAVDLTLHEVIEKTYQRNPHIEVLQAKLKHVDALSENSKSFLSADPTFQITHYNDVIMSNDGIQEWEIGMALPLWRPGQKAARKKSVEQERSFVTASEPALKLEVAGLVRDLLWTIALTKNRVNVAKREWKIVAKLEQDVLKRVELGDLAQSDLILAQQESLLKEAGWRTAQQEYRHAQHRYDLITGLDTLPVNFEETITGDLTITLDHPLLKKSHKKVARSMAQRDQLLIEKRGNPSLFLGTRSERGSSSEDYADAIGLSFSMPFGLAAHTTPKVTKSEVDLTKNRSAMEILRRDLDITLQDASRELSATIEQYGFARRQNELSNKNLKMSRKAFSLGEKSLIELIIIQGQALAAERNMRQKQLEIGFQKARLNQAKGIIP